MGGRSSSAGIPPDGRSFAAYLLIGDSRAQQAAIVVIRLSGPL